MYFFLNYWQDIHIFKYHLFLKSKPTVVLMWRHCLHHLWTQHSPLSLSFVVCHFSLNCTHPPLLIPSPSVPLSHICIPNQQEEGDEVRGADPRPPQRPLLCSHTTGTVTALIPTSSSYILPYFTNMFHIHTPTTFSLILKSIIASGAIKCVGL